MASLKTRFLRVWLLIGFLPVLAGFRFGPTAFDADYRDYLRNTTQRHSSSLPSTQLSDPGPVLTWNTFLGKNDGTDYGFKITVNGSGDSYVTGISNAAWGIPVRDYTGASDAFVAKFDSGGHLIWNTFLGGSHNDYGEEIAVDGSGNVYVTGLTEATYGSGTWGSPIRPFMGQQDAFVAKLDSSGNLLWNTFLGSSALDWGRGLTAAPDGHVYVTGSSSATWGDVIVRGFTAIEDAFVAKLDSQGNLLWTSFFGGPGFDYGSGMTAGSNGGLYLTGFSTATFGSASWGTPVRGYSGGGDAFVATLDSGGNLIWNTFLGGNGYEYGRAAAVDGAGKIYVVGISNAIWGNPVRDYAFGIDGFAANLDASGNLLWNTFLGGNGLDEGDDIAVDEKGNSFIAGDSSAAWGDPTRAFTAAIDAFEANLDSAGNLISHTFLGGSGYDYSHGLALDNDGSVLIAGSSTATWGTPVSEYTYPTDAFVAKLDSPPFVLSTSLTAVMDSGPGSFTVTFNEELSNPPGNTDPDDATNPNNYLLVDKGINASADTISCAGGVSTDDQQVTVTSVTHTASTLTSTVTLAQKLTPGKYRLFVCGTTSIVDLSNTPLAGDGKISGTDYTFDFVVELDQPPLVASTSLKPKMDSGPDQFTVTFSEDVSDPAGNSMMDDVTNPNNYVLISKGFNELTDTISCAGGVIADDEKVGVTGVTYNAAAFTSTVTLAQGVPAGKYRLLVCGTTSIVDLGSTALAGNGLTPGTDYIFDFTINTPPATAQRGTASLPKTGFAPHIVTTLPWQPREKAYLSLSDLWLEIPSQNLKTNIVGIPQSEHGWDVTWLGNDVGWLNGTAFPSWEGNSVLTAHVYNSNGLPGPFINLKDLGYGERIIVHLYGEKYIFEVQSTRLTRPSSTSFALEHLEDHSYLTLVTCQGYNPLNDSYLFRRVVRAVLVKVE